MELDAKSPEALEGNGLPTIAPCKYFKIGEALIERYFAKS